MQRSFTSIRKLEVFNFRLAGIVLSDLTKPHGKLGYWILREGCFTVFAPFVCPEISGRVASRVEYALHFPEIVSSIINVLSVSYGVF